MALNMSIVLETLSFAKLEVRSTGKRPYRFTGGTQFALRVLMIPISPLNAYAHK